MALTRVDPGLQNFPDFTRDQQLANAKIYVGVPGLDPTVPANQYQVYVVQENGTQVAVPQPVRTSAGGIPTYNGSPVQIAVAENVYSLKVLNANDVQIYYFPNSAHLAIVDAAQVTYKFPVPAGVERTVEGKLADLITSRDFGVPGDLTDDGQNHVRLLNGAIESLKKGQPFVPQGNILVSANVNWDTRTSVYDNIDPLIPNGSPKRLQLDLSQCRIFAKGSAFADSRYAELSGNGVQVAFTIPFAFASNARVIAYVNGSQVTPASVTGQGLPAGSGVVTFSVPPGAGLNNIKLFYRDQNINDVITISTQSDGTLYKPKAIIYKDTPNLNWMHFFNTCLVRVVFSDRLVHENPVMGGLINSSGAVDFGPGINYWLDDCMTPCLFAGNFLYGTRYGCVTDTGIASVDPLVSKSSVRVMTSGTIGTIYCAGGRPGGLSRNDYTGFYPAQSFYISAPTGENGNNPGCLLYIETDTNTVVSPWCEGAYDTIFLAGGFGANIIGGCFIRSSPANYGIEGRGAYAIPGTIAPRTPPAAALNSATIMDASSFSPGIQLGKSIFVQGNIQASGEIGINANWTPTTNGDPTGAISAASGKSQKIGSLVVCTFTFTVTANFTNSAIGGLPYAAAGAGVVSAGIALCGSGAAGTLTLQLNGGGTTFFFRRNSDVNTPHSPTVAAGTYTGHIAYFV